MRTKYKLTASWYEEMSKNQLKDYTRGRNNRKEKPFLCNCNIIFQMATHFPYSLAELYERECDSTIAAKQRKKK